MKGRGKPLWIAIGCAKLACASPNEANDPAKARSDSPRMADVQPVSEASTPSPAPPGSPQSLPAQPEPTREQAREAPNEPEPASLAHAPESRLGLPVDGLALLGLYREVYCAKRTGGEAAVATLWASRGVSSEQWAKAIKGLAEQAARDPSGFGAQWEAVTASPCPGEAAGVPDVDAPPAAAH
jgi:hypothetical protein